MYKKVDTSLDFVGREKEVLKFWQDNDVFKQSMKIREGSPVYTFYDGPPTANGKPHIGHVLTRVIKDMIPRFHTMNGEQVPRKAGWDTHGLPVELEVERKLGLNGKEQIEEYGMEPFIKECKESVWKYKGMWEDFSETVGFWADMDDPYVTYENDYIESVWWALKQIWEKGLLYKGFKIVPYCPRCGTPLSAQEVAQGYKLVKERSAVVRMKAKDEEAYYLVWTTTPWTLPSNVALCVNANVTYCKVKACDGYTYILAKDLADTVLGGLEREEGAPAYEILEEMQGKDLEYREYEPLFDYTGKEAERQKKKSHFVCCDDYVTTTDGTGIVHLAAAFGEDDNRVCAKYGVAFIQFVDNQGNMTKETPYAGIFVKKADPIILKDLEAEGKLFSAPKFEHEYPHCWRCDTPLIYYARESWFIRMTEVKEDLIKNNNTINWIPESIGKGRFGDWLENVQDWGISRNRYWGTPLNIWVCEDCGHMHSIGSVEELKSMSDNCPDDIELHRPYIDEVTIKCPVCGRTMRRVPEVIDCWFDSGAMPFAQYHYPFENKEYFESHFPAQFISEAVDQTRGWFYSLLAISTLVFNKAPYENVIVLGHVQDENGQKMSKSKGNAVDPFDALATYGADAIRWYFYINSAPWLPNRFHGKAVSEFSRRFMGTLWNTYAFYVLYADIDSFDPTKYSLEYDKLGVMDKWLLSRLYTTVSDVHDMLSAYKIPEAARTMESFIDDCSNWYVRRSRERFWAKGMEQDKINAYMTLYTALVEFSKTAAPMVPFITEQIYQNLVRTFDSNAPISIHLCDYPEVRKEMILPELEKDMKNLLDIVVMGRACRNSAAIKNRQPLGLMYVKSDFRLSEYYVEIIEEELNIKKVEFTDDVSEYVSYSFKPQLKTVGPKYGKLVGAIRGALAEIDGTAAMAELKSTGKLTLNAGGETIELAEEDLLIEAARVEGFVSESNASITVVLDTHLTDELIEEGYVRELVSKIQTMRKEAGFEVMDRIVVYAKDSEKIEKVLKDNKDEICGEVLADEIVFGRTAGYEKEWNINDCKIKLGVEKQN